MWRKRKQRDFQAEIDAHVQLGAAVVDLGDAGDGHDLARARLGDLDAAEALVAVEQGDLDRLLEPQPPLLLDVPLQAGDQLVDGRGRRCGGDRCRGVAPAGRRGRARSRRRPSSEGCDAVDSIPAEIPYVAPYLVAGTSSAAKAVLARASSYSREMSRPAA